MFTCQCPYCGQQLEAQDDWDGQVTVCPKCQQEITMFKSESPTPTAENNKRRIDVTHRSRSHTRSGGSSKTAHKFKSDIIRLLEDDSEDKSVLVKFQRIKKSCRTITIFLVSIITIAAIACFYAKIYNLGLVAVLICIILVYNYWVVNLALSWLRGTYRNLLRIVYFLASSESDK